MADRMLCAIPARGGSKRLPRKNLRTLAGVPLIAYSIEVARGSGLFDQVYVCTEDQEIADVARKHGASVPILVPEDLCGDLVASHIPCQYMAQYLASAGDSIDMLVCLQPTSPLRNVDDLTSAVKKFQETDLDFLVSVTPVDPHDFHWAVVPNGDGYWRMYFGNEYMKERPLLPPVFRPNGSIKIARLPALARVGHFFGERMSVIETPPERSVHVALEFDLKLCELLLKEKAA
ncbi:MAG TPA: acylneuraminate cytidylyltransferase family protein [Candidatus Sulfotelmatobacter sp.]|jgi:CMP-N-acetylneuraminic acid synthetase|nr:acylneuraminate cytidylyltransferase family protein [Candidatus Sulfotelmatobacter sp.]